MAVGIVYNGKAHPQAEGEVRVSESSISMKMLFRYLIKMKAECNKARLAVMFAEMFEMSIKTSEYERLGIPIKVTWGNTSGKKSDRYSLPVLICSKDIVSQQPGIMEIKVPELVEDPDFRSYCKEITESAIQFFHENLFEEVQNALDNLLWESQLSAMKKVARSHGLPDSIPKNIINRVKKNRLSLIKEKFNIRRGRNRNSLTRSPEALLNRQRKGEEQREQRKANLLEAAITLLRAQANGEPKSEINKTNLALVLGKSRQTIHNWMMRDGYDPSKLEEDANQELRRKVNN